MNTAGDSDADTIKHAIELALLTAGQPLTIRDLKRVLEGNTATDRIKQALEALQQDWSERALQLTESASGYQFISKAEYTPHLRRLKPQRPPRLSRSLLEVLAIIAYRQPVTRGDIEQIRSIVVSSNQIAFLEELGWIEEIGRRETPGRPALYATTNTFLDDLGLVSLNELPPLPEIEEDRLEALGGADELEAEMEAEADAAAEQETGAAAEEETGAAAEEETGAAAKEDRKKQHNDDADASNSSTPNDPLQ